MYQLQMWLCWTCRWCENWKQGSLSRRLTSKTEAQGREYEVISDADQQQGILTTNTYMCPKCDSVEVYAYLEQTRSSDEPETRMLTCANVNVSTDGVSTELL